MSTRQTLIHPIYGRGGNLRASMRVALGCAAVAVGLLLTAVSARADFGVKDFDLTFQNKDGSPATQADSHPFSVTSVFDLNTTIDPHYGEVPDGQLRTLAVKLPDGFTGSPAATPRCATVDFLTQDTSANLACADSTAVGVATARFGEPTNDIAGPVYNLVPPPGAVAKIGFFVFNVPTTLVIGVSPEPPYKVVSSLSEVPQAVEVYGGSLTLWGVPADPAHDSLRGRCLSKTVPPGGGYLSSGTCATKSAEVPFLVLPRSCTGPLETAYEVASWQSPLDPPLSGSAFSHDFAEPPNPQGMTGCSKLNFAPAISARPTTLSAQSPTGLDFSLDVSDEGLMSPHGLANADIERASVALPPGMSVNPSQAEGLEVCTEADAGRETAGSGPGEGCPQASKVGTLEVETPLLPDQILKGSLYVAKPYENPFGSLLALYIVIKDPELGISIVQPAKVTPDPQTGQIVTTTTDMPQVPFSHFRLHFREGTRSPLVSPPDCGSYDGHDSSHEPVRAVLYPSSGGPPVESTSTFQILDGPSGGPCPTGGLPPFRPHLEAGSLNNAAGRFSPFNVKLTRTDSEQEFTHFSIKLPPGVAGKLAGVASCSDAQIARATARTGPHGGAEELADPSCPPGSYVGRTLAGAGVGPSLAYAPGNVYLAGPYHGHPISLVAITAGVVGPFDIGTVVVRLAIDVNPETGEVFLDSTGSDPIPHIVKGIQLHVRDIRAYTDRPEFTFNPTSCERKSTAATVLGSGLDFVSGADDNPFVSTSPFQAADCAALPFEPRLGLRLIGSTKRGGFPKLKAFLRMRGFGEAGVARARVTLPRSEFIANAHFDTICTRVQFKLEGGNGEACPPGSIYGWARAKSPILADPVEGPIFLRSSEHELPDLVASLRGQEINVHLVGHVDSVKGQLRNTFETVPDAPVDWASFSFKGQKKGLFENSTDLCEGKHRAKVEFTGQNGKVDNYRSALKVNCKGGKGKPKKHGRHARAAHRGRAAR